MSNVRVIGSNQTQLLLQGLSHRYISQFLNLWEIGNFSTQISSQLGRSLKNVPSPFSIHSTFGAMQRRCRTWYSTSTFVGIVGCASGGGLEGGYVTQMQMKWTIQDTIQGVSSNIAVPFQISPTQPIHFRLNREIANPTNPKESKYQNPKISLKKKKNFWSVSAPSTDATVQDIFWPGNLHFPLSRWLGQITLQNEWSMNVSLCHSFLYVFAFVFVFRHVVKTISALILLYMLCIGLIEIC